MTQQEAFKIVLELARQNMADECEMEAEHRRQDKAITIVENMVKLETQR